MTTVSPKLTDRMLVLATAGAARLGLTLGQALAMSDPFNPASGAHQTASDDAKQDNPATTSTPTTDSADETH